MRESRVYFWIVLAGIALAVKVYWVVPEEDITNGAIEAAVFFLKDAMLLASFVFGLHSSL